jgi:ankyrin repeat protein
MSSSELDTWFDQERLHIAAQDGDKQMVETLLEQGRNPNTFDDLGLTPLHLAAKAGHLEIVKCLVKSGADVNAHDESHIVNTPLGEIAGNCSYEMAKLLLDLGANPTIKGWMQLSALDRAKDRKRNEGRRVYELLLLSKDRFTQTQS